MEMGENVLVFGEVEGDRLTASTLELLGIGGRLAADLQHDLRLVHLGAGIPSALDEAYGYGADVVCAAADPLLGEYEPELYLQAAVQAVERLRPSVILFGQTDRGLDLAPRLAFRLRTGATLDCVDLAIDGETRRLKQVKPVFGGKAHAAFYCHAWPQVVSIRQGSFAPATYQDSREGDVVPLDLSLDVSRVRTKLLRKIEDEGSSLATQLASADVVASGGRGLGSKDGVALLAETAGLLGGAIAGSRAAVESGWLPRSVLVGLTGRRVNPRLYIAVGISGSLHHMAGCMRSRTIVAVNTDDSAPIFTFSQIGAVGDYREILRGFNDEVQRIREGG